MKNTSDLRKSKVPPKEVKGNVDKYATYREAWSRIKLAQENNFFLEAITIQESIISDRLKRFLSFSTSTNSLEESHNKKYVSFYKLINAWRKHFPNGLESGQYTDLIAATDAWRMKRNKAIHSIINPKCDEPIPPIDYFLNQAKEASEEGTHLAREICKWCQKEKKIKL